MTVTIFWYVAVCSLIETERRSGGAYRLRHQGDDPEDGGSTHRLMSIHLYESALRHVPQYCVNFIVSLNLIIVSDVR